MTDEEVAPDDLKMFLVVSDGQPRVITKPVSPKLKCGGCLQTFNSEDSLKCHRDNYICGRIFTEIPEAAENDGGAPVVVSSNILNDEPGNGCVTKPDIQNMVATDLEGSHSHGTIGDAVTGKIACNNSKDGSEDINVGHEKDSQRLASGNTGSPNPADGEPLENQNVVPGDAERDLEKSVFHPSLKSHRHLFADYKACIYCGKLFDNDLDLEDHIRGHVAKCNGNEDQSRPNTEFNEIFPTQVSDEHEEGAVEEMETVEKENEDSEICVVTEKNKKSKATLICQYCEKTFARESLLKKHIAIHTRPYSCPACGKSFGRRSHLNRHVRGHADHICSICNLMCDSAKSLKLHRDSHFQDEDGVLEQDVQPPLEDYDITVKLRAEDKSTAPGNNIQGIWQVVGNTDVKIVKDKLSYSETSQPAPDVKKIDPRKAVKFANLDRKIKMLHKFKNEQNKGVTEMNDSPLVEAKNDTDTTYEVDASVVTTPPGTVASENSEGQSVLQALGLQYKKETFQGVGSVIRCEQCGKVFLEMHEYRIHLRSHTGERPFRCGTCGKAFKQSSHLYGHMKIHFGDKDYICSICNKSFSKCSALKKHMFVHGEYIESGANLEQAAGEIDSEKNKRPPSPSINLSIQGDHCSTNSDESKKGEQLADIDEHSKEDDVEKYGGSTDDEGDISAAKLPHVDHGSTENVVPQESLVPVQSRSLSLVEVKFEKKESKKSKKTKVSNSLSLAGHLLANECEVCGKIMSSKSSLRKHLYLHSGKKPYKCGVCNKSYPHSWYLTSHMKFHTDSWAHFCKLCDMHFMYKSTLKRHLCRKHKLDGEECSQLLNFSEVRSTKRKSVHAKSEKKENMQITSNTLQAELTKSEIELKKYVCRFCKLMFPNHSLLRIHLRIHAKPRRFRCMRCSLTCKDYGKLRRHRFLRHKCHKGGWKCYFCEMSFFKFLSWKEHMKYQHPERMPGGCKDSNKDERSDEDNVETVPGEVKSERNKRKKLNLATQQDPQQSFSTPEMKSVIKSIVSSLDTLEKDTLPDFQDPAFAHLKEKLYSPPNLALNNPCFVQSLRIQAEGSTNKKAPKCKTCGKLFSSRGQLKKHGRIHSGEKPFKCDTCGKSFTQSSHLWSHLKIHTGEKPYSCEVCNMRFNTSSSLNRHMRVHRNEKPYQCHLCGRSYRTSYGLRMHIMKHTGEKNFVCDVCQKDFYEKRLLDMHYRVHTGETPFKCSSCERSFATSRQLRRHTRSHLEFNFHCSHCEKQFREGRELTNHMKVHTEVDKYYCKECDKRFPDQRGLLRHKVGHINNSFGDNSKRYHKCEYCKKEFTQKRNLRSHVLARHKVIMEAFSCDQCGLDFTGKTQLETHMTDEHGIVKPFECRICGSRYNWKRNLNNHMHKAHQDVDELKYTCSDCGQEFTQEHRLKSHMKIHMIFKCETCGKEFNREYTFKNHMKVHTGESRHRCQKCGRCFSQKSNLDIHKLSHSETRDYTCEDCDKIFKFKSSLVKHFRNHHPDRMDELSKHTTGRVEAETLIDSSNIDNAVEVHEAMKNYEAKRKRTEADIESDSSFSFETSNMDNPDAEPGAVENSDEDKSPDVNIESDSSYAMENSNTAVEHDETPGAVEDLEAYREGTEDMESDTSGCIDSTDIDVEGHESIENSDSNKKTQEVDMVSDSSCTDEFE